jgi:hypothetical protein
LDFIVIIPEAHIIGGNDLRMIILLLYSLALIGIIAAENAEEKEQLEDTNPEYSNPTILEERILKFNLEQNVSGTGFYAIYRYALMPDAIGTDGRGYNGVETKNKAHGSGQMFSDSEMYAENSYTNKTWVNGAYDEDGIVIQDEEETTSVIQIREDSKMIYSPIVMDIGSRYYNQHPLAFSSLIKEEDWIKNRKGFNSLNHLVDQAHGLNKVLEARSDLTNNTMNIEEDLVNGRARVGALQLVGIPMDEETEESDSEEVQVPGSTKKSWKKPLIEIEEEYVGTFHILKNMNLYTYTEEKEEEESWLPCCNGGYRDMMVSDSKYSKAKSIFDCTCFKPPAEIRS